MSRGKLLAFRIVAGVFGVVTLAASVVFLVQSFTDDADMVHRVHNVGGLVGFGFLLEIPLVLLAWRPRQTAVFRVVLASVVATILAALLSRDLISGSFFVAPIVAGVLLLLYPWRPDLFAWAEPRIIGLVLAALALGPALIYALHQSRIMRAGDPSTDTTGHWANHHWTGMAAAGLALALGAGVAAFGGRARRSAATLVGLGAVALGATSLALPDMPSALQGPWPYLAMAWGVAYLVDGVVLAGRPT